MPFSTAERTLVFELLGVPQGGDGLKTTQIGTLSGPHSDVYDFDFLVTQINARLDEIDAASDGRLARIQTILTDLPDLLTSTIKITEDTSGAKGRIVDHEMEVAKRRMAVSNLMGIQTPDGGFAHEARIRDSSMRRRFLR